MNQPYHLVAILIKAHVFPRAMCQGLDKSKVTSSFRWALPLPRLLQCLETCLHLRGNSFSLGTNVTIPGQYYKYSSWKHFSYSQINFMEFLYMPKELSVLSDRVLSHSFPTRKSSHAGAGRKIGQWKRRGRGMAHLNVDVI